MAQNPWDFAPSRVRGFSLSGAAGFALSRWATAATAQKDLFWTAAVCSRGVAACALFCALIFALVDARFLFGNAFVFMCASAHRPTAFCADTAFALGHTATTDGTHFFRLGGLLERWPLLAREGFFANAHTLAFGAAVTFAGTHFTLFANQAFDRRICPLWRHGNFNLRLF